MARIKRWFTRKEHGRTRHIPISERHHRYPREEFEYVVSKGWGRHATAAKFPGKCLSCGQLIHPGDRIYFRRGEGAIHADCDFPENWIKGAIKKPEALTKTAEPADQVGKQGVIKGDHPRTRIGGTGSILPLEIGVVKDLLARKEVRLASRFALGTGLKMTGTDLLASVVIAAAKGYQEAEKHGLESGVEKAAVEFTKAQVVGAIADDIASSAVQYATSTGGLELDRTGKEIVTDAVASAIVAL